MEEKEAIMLLEQIDNTGCCTYVAMTNAILCSFKNNPDDFEKAFGYPMYIELDGQKKLNSQELLLDMYIWINSNKNNISSDLFSYDENGKLNIQSFFNDDIYTDDQIYIQDGLYDNTDIADIMSDFLNSKSIEISDDDFSNYKDFKSNDEIKNYIKDGLRNNEQMIIGFSNVDSSKKVVMTGVNSNRVANVYQWGKDEGHEAYITSYDDEGVIVSSYGDKYKITYDDLKNAEFNINKININYTGGEN
jgi:hypothetical protein